MHYISYISYGKSVCLCVISVHEHTRLQAQFEVHMHVGPVILY